MFRAGGEGGGKGCGSKLMFCLLCLDGRAKARARWNSSLVWIRSATIVRSLGTEARRAKRVGVGTRASVPEPVLVFKIKTGGRKAALDADLIGCGAEEVGEDQGTD